MRKALSLRLTTPLALAALLAVASACNDDTATVLEPLGRTYNFLLLKEGANGPRGSGGVVTRTTTNTSTISDFTIQGLEKLEGSAGYVFWTARIAPNPADPKDSILTNIARLRTRLFTAVRVDTTINSTGDFVPTTTTVQNVNAIALTPTMNFGGPNVTYTFRTDSATLGFYPHSRNVIFMTLVTDTAAPTTPAADGSDVRLWNRYTSLAPTGTATSTTAGGTWQFGNFHPAAAKQYVFVASGRGRGSLVPETNTLIVNDSLLARPPKGYYYETFLIKRDDNATFYATDSITVGPQTAPPPQRNVSLKDADITDIAGIVQNPPGFPQLQLIYAAANRINCSGSTCTNSLGQVVPRLAATGNAYRKIANIQISLEAKLGTARQSPFIILNGVAPPPIRARD